jgi:hypothetical protein
MANTNEALVYGWSNQALGATAGQTGYAQPGVAPTVANVSTALQASSGASSAPAPTAVAEVLTNPGYADGEATMVGAITAPSVPATTVALQSPTGLASRVTLTGGTVTAVQVAPNVGGSAGTYTTVATATGVTVTVPPAGFIKLTYSAAPTWSWVTTN